MNKQAGVTLVELVIGVAIVGLISVMVTGILFFALSLRDRSVVSEQLVETGRILDRVLSVISEGSVIEGGGGSLRVTGNDRCLSVLADGGGKRLLYELVEEVACTPSTNPSTEFLPGAVEVTGVNFAIREIGNGGFEVRVSATLRSVRPLSSKTVTYDQTFISLVDR